MKLIN
jgi:ribosomal protein S10